MADQASPANLNLAPNTKEFSESSDEPLFVLKYRREKVIKRLIPFFFFFYIVGFGLFHKHPPRYMQVVGVITLSCLVFLFMDILLFKKVLLYNDKMVRVGHLFGNREISLADAQLQGRAVVFGLGRLTIVHNKYKCFSQRGLIELWAETVGVSYYEMLADPDDVKKLNALLADLTGRRVEEFEQLSIRMDRLIERKDEGGSF
jgi:hypothetical protein